MWSKFNYHDNDLIHFLNIIYNISHSNCYYLISTIKWTIKIIEIDHNYIDTVKNICDQNENNNSMFCPYFIRTFPVPLDFNLKIDHSARKLFPQHATSLN